MPTKKQTKKTPAKKEAAPPDMIHVTVTIPVKMTNPLRPRFAPVMNYRCQQGEEAVVFEMMRRGVEESGVSAISSNGQSRPMFYRTDLMRFIMQQVMANEDVARAAQGAPML